MEKSYNSASEAGSFNSSDALFLKISVAPDNVSNWENDLFL